MIAQLTVFAFRWNGRPRTTFLPTFYFLASPDPVLCHSKNESVRSKFIHIFLESCQLQSATVLDFVGVYGVCKELFVYFEPYNRSNPIWVSLMNIGAS